MRRIEKTDILKLYVQVFNQWRLIFLKKQNVAIKENATEMFPFLANETASQYTKNLAIKAFRCKDGSDEHDSN